MADRPKNQEIGTQGSSIVLDIMFYTYDGGSLADPSPTPTYIIKNPQGTEVNSGTGTRISTGKYTATYSIPSDAEVSPSWSIEWTAYINGVLVSGASEYFIVYSIGYAGFSDEILISQAFLEEIKTVLAYPSVENIILTDSQIKSLCISPALRTYYTKFPLTEVYTQSFAGGSPIDVSFPDIYTFGVVDARITDKLGEGNNASDSFWQLAAFNKYGMSPIMTNYGKKGYNPSFLRQQKITAMQAQMAFKNSIEAIKFKVDIVNRKVTVYTNQTAMIFIEWAKYSNDFSNVKYQRINEVIALAQANLLDQLADSTGLFSNSTLEITVNASDLRARAAELRDKVIEKWNDISSVVLINF